MHYKKIFFKALSRVKKNKTKKSVSQQPPTAPAVSIVGAGAVPWGDITPNRPSVFGFFFLIFY